MISQLVYIVFLVGVAAGDSSLAAVFHDSQLVSCDVKPGSPCDQSQGVFIGCSGDSRSLLLCISNMVTRINCEQQTVTKPYCDYQTKSCVEEPINEPKPPQPSICPLKKGVFPQLLNCKYFMSCNENVASTYTCMGSAVYDPLTEKCSLTAPCYSFSATDGLCKDKIGQLVAHPRSTKLYVLCFLNPILLACDGDNYFFDKTTKRCEFKCPGLGIFKDDTSSQHYYICERVGSKVMPNRGNCGDGNVFQPDILACTTK